METKMTTTEEIRLSVLRNTIQYEKVRLTFDRVCEVLARHTTYEDLDGKGHKDVTGTLRIQSVKIFKTNVSAHILLNSRYLSTQIIAELDKTGYSSFGTKAVSSIGITDGFLSIDISSLENERTD